MLKKSNAQAANPALAEYIGGMRDPYKVMLGRSTALTLGLELRAAWEAFEKRHPGATGVAETYGTPDCTLDKDVVQLWKAAMKKTLGANAPPSVRMKPRWKYLSPLDPELFEAWITRASDPDDVIPDWIRNGAPLGIEAEIPVRGIFPKYNDESNMDYQSSKELEDASAQLGRGEVTNYSSVSDNLDDALIELDRYRQEGYLADVPKQVVQDEMGHGTISKLGLIIKEKPEGKKRRIILDLRRSGGNRKAQLPEKLVLPRPKDAVAMIRNNYVQRRIHQADEGYSREHGGDRHQRRFHVLGGERSRIAPHVGTEPKIRWLRDVLRSPLWVQNSPPLMVEDSVLLSKVPSIHGPRWRGSAPSVLG